MPRCVYGGMKTVFAAAFVVTLLAAELVPVLAGEGDPPVSPGTVPGNPATSVTTMPDEIDSRETTIPEPPRVDPREVTVPETTIPEPPPAESTTTTAEPPNVETVIDGPPLVVNGEAISPDLMLRRQQLTGSLVFRVASSQLGPSDSRWPPSLPGNRERKRPQFGLLSSTR